MVTTSVIICDYLKHSQIAHETQMFRIVMTDDYGNHPPERQYPPYCGEAAKSVTALGKHDLTRDCGDDHSLRAKWQGGKAPLLRRAESL